MPYPADYGGVIDVFYRIVALHEIGVKIHLHCFEYGKTEQAELNKYCVEVNYYKRNTGIKGFSFLFPYVVKSRANAALLAALLKDEYPVLMEGVHSTYFLYTNKLKHKKVFVRLHNIEFDYYRQLAINEKSILKKIYFKIESRLLKKYERAISNKATLLAITPKDENFFRHIFNAPSVHYLPPFILSTKIRSKQGNGNFCLYHGNLSISENEITVIWLCQNVFADLGIAFIVAGKNPSKHLQKTITQNKNISLVANPSEEKLNGLIANAQINVLHSLNSSGIKIKLLHALFCGRHCLVNKASIDAFNYSRLCNIAETKIEYRQAIQKLFSTAFSEKEISERKKILGEEFNNETNAAKLIEWIQ